MSYSDPFSEQGLHREVSECTKCGMHSKTSWGMLAQEIIGCSETAAEAIMRQEPSTHGPESIVSHVWLYLIYA